MRIGPVLEVTTSFQHFKYGIEIRIWSVNRDNSQSWVRISYGTIKYVVDSIQDNTEIPADPQEEQIPQTSTSVVATRSKAKAKPQQRELVGTTATIPMHERRWIDIEPSEPTLAAFDVSKKVISLLRLNQTLQTMAGCHGFPGKSGVLPVHSLGGLQWVKDSIHVEALQAGSWRKRPQLLSSWKQVTIQIGFLTGSLQSIGVTVR